LATIGHAVVIRETHPEGMNACVAILAFFAVKSYSQNAETITTTIKIAAVGRREPEQKRDRAFARSLVLIA
jgi:hypothetical protein